MEQTPGKAFYQQQIAALEAYDIDALMAQYHPDAAMIGFDFTVKGHTAIRKHFVGYLERLGTLKLKSTDKFTETDDSIFSVLLKSRLCLCKCGSRGLRMFPKLPYRIC